MTHTLCVFDVERTLSESLPLLGRLVANPRRPLDRYRPRIDTTQQQDQKPSILDPSHIVAKQSGDINANAIRSVEASTKLGEILGLGSGFENKITYTLSGEELKIYALQQYDDAWETLKSAHQTEVESFIQENNGRAYCMVTLQTANKSSVSRLTAHDKSAGGQIQVPISAATGGAVPSFIGDPHVEFKMNSSMSAAVRGTIQEEIALAAEYCKVILHSDYRFSFQKLVSHKQILKMKPEVKAFSGKTLAYGRDSDDSSDEDEDDEEDSELGQEGYQYI